MRSKTIRKTLSPQWDERFTFHGILGELIEEPLLIKLWDYDVASLNDGMGEIEVPLDAVLENGQISLPHEPLYGASSGTLSVRVAWFPYAGQGTAVMRLLRCGRMVSTKQHAKPQADHLLRATIAIDIVGFIGVILLGSADIIYRMHGPAEPLAFFTDFFPLWCAAACTSFSFWRCDVRMYPCNGPRDKIKHDSLPHPTSPARIFLLVF
uniref:C2 domain-containing protein n=2 Tax=Chrysotila carterae TaxID=13221 RepID=A0A7S4B2N1_CHRCT